MQIDTQNFPYSDVVNSTTIKAFQVTNTTEGRIDGGTIFQYSEVTDTSTGVARELLLTTPSAKDIHLTIKVITEGEADFKFYEDTTTTSTGIAVTSCNRDRGSATVATMTVKHSPTVSGNGTLIQSKHWVNNRDSSEGNREQNKWILDVSSKYLISVKNDSSANNQIAIELNWNEV
jgi:hypothetical protein